MSSKRSARRSKRSARRSKLSGSAKASADAFVSSMLLDGIESGSGSSSSSSATQRVNLLVLGVPPPPPPSFSSLATPPTPGSLSLASLLRSCELEVAEDIRVVGATVWLNGASASEASALGSPAAVPAPGAPPPPPPPETAANCAHVYSLLAPSLIYPPVLVGGAGCTRDVLLHTEQPSAAAYKRVTSSRSFTELPTLLVVLSDPATDADRLSDFVRPLLPMRLAAAVVLSPLGADFSSTPLAAVDLSCSRFVSPDTPLYVWHERLAVPTWGEHRSLHFLLRQGAAPRGLQALHEWPSMDQAVAELVSLVEQGGGDSGELQLLARVRRAAREFSQRDLNLVHGRVLEALCSPAAGSAAAQSLASVVQLPALLAEMRAEMRAEDAGDGEEDLVPLEEVMERALDRAWAAEELILAAQEDAAQARALLAPNYTKWIEEAGFGRVSLRDCYRSVSELQHVTVHGAAHLQRLARAHKVSVVARGLLQDDAPSALLRRCRSLLPAGSQALVLRGVAGAAGGVGTARLAPAGAALAACGTVSAESGELDSVSLVRALPNQGAILAFLPVLPVFLQQGFLAVLGMNLCSPELAALDLCRAVLLDLLAPQGPLSAWGLSGRLLSPPASPTAKRTPGARAVFAAECLVSLLERAGLNPLHPGPARATVLVLVCMLLTNGETVAVPGFGKLLMEPSALGGQYSARAHSLLLRLERLGCLPADVFGSSMRWLLWGEISNATVRDRIRERQRRALLQQRANEERIARKASQVPQLLLKQLRRIRASSSSGDHWELTNGLLRLRSFSRAEALQLANEAPGGSNHHPRLWQRPNSRKRGSKRNRRGPRVPHSSWSDRKLQEHEYLAFQTIPDPVLTICGFAAWCERDETREYLGRRLGDGTPIFTFVDVHPVPEPGQPWGGAWENELSLIHDWMYLWRRHTVPEGIGALQQLPEDPMRYGYHESLVYNLGRVLRTELGISCSYHDRSLAFSDEYRPLVVRLWPKAAAADDDEAKEEGKGESKEVVEEQHELPLLQRVLDAPHDRLYEALEAFAGFPIVELSDRFGVDRRELRNIMAMHKRAVDLKITPTPDQVFGAIRALEGKEEEEEEGGEGGAPGLCFLHVQAIANSDTQPCANAKCKFRVCIPCAQQHALGALSALGKQVQPALCIACPACKTPYAEKAREVILQQLDWYDAENAEFQAMCAPGSSGFFRCARVQVHGVGGIREGTRGPIAYQEKEEEEEKHACVVVEAAGDEAHGTLLCSPCIERQRKQAQNDEHLARVQRMRGERTLCLLLPCCGKEFVKGGGCNVISCAECKANPNQPKAYCCYHCREAFTNYRETREHLERVVAQVNVQRAQEGKGVLTASELPVKQNAVQGMRAFESTPADWRPEAPVEAPGGPMGS